MARTKRKIKPLPTIWQVSDELWNIIQDMLDELVSVGGGGFGYRLLGIEWPHRHDHIHLSLGFAKRDPD